MNNTYEKKAKRLVLLCWLAYTIVYIGKKTLSVNLADMIADGVCDNATGGTIGTAFLACYAIGQLISGWAGEKIRPRYMICGGLFMAGCCNLLMSFGNSFPYFALVWGLCGVFCSMLWAPIIRAVALWTTEEISHSAGASLTVTIPAGTMLCYAFCALALKIGNWRTAFLLCGLILCVAALILWFFFASLRDHTDGHVIREDPHPPAEGEGAVPASSVKLFCAGLVFTAICILFNGVIKDGLDLWIPTILNDRFISDSFLVSLICTILPVINIGGIYGAKYVYSRYKLTELGTCAILFSISALCLGGVLLLVRFAGGGLFIAITATVLLALSGAAMLGANAMLLTFIPFHFGKIGRASALTGMLNGFSYGAAALSGVVIGSLSKAAGWEAVFLTCIVASILGALFAFLGKAPLGKKIRQIHDSVRT